MARRKEVQQDAQGEQTQMSFEELNAEIQRLTEMRDRAKETTRKELAAHVRRVIEDNDLSLDSFIDELVGKNEGQPRKRGVKYRDPVSGAEWSGLGRMKKAFAELISQGHSLDEYLVRDE